MPADTAHYFVHRVLARPLGWSAVGAAASAIDKAMGEAGGALYGAWRSQIGRPRDEVTLISRWTEDVASDVAEQALLSVVAPVREASTRPMRTTLRPLTGDAPRRQGNFAFRWFETPKENYAEFLKLCAEAWPGFEASYDSQVLGLWRLEPPAKKGKATAKANADQSVRTLLLTRRPDLAMWERSKIPKGKKEQLVRERLSRRYDLCDDTWVFTTTLLTADDTEDDVRWT